MQKAVVDSITSQSSVELEGIQPEAESPSEHEKIRIRAAVEANRGMPSALIRVLQDVQSRLGHIPMWSQHIVSKEMGIPFSEVHGVVTFYNFFSQHPKGRHVIQVCQGTACYVRGGKKIMDQLKRKLGVGPGETTRDRKFSLEVVRCLGCCGLSPVMTVSGNLYRRISPKKVSEILEAYN